MRIANTELSGKFESMPVSGVGGLEKSTKTSMAESLASYEAEQEWRARQRCAGMNSGIKTFLFFFLYMFLE